MDNQSPRRSVRTATGLRDVIIDTLADTVAATLAATGSEDVDINPYIRRILEAADEYAQNRPDTRPTVAQMRSGPSLTYVHTDNDTMTAVDCAAITSNPRERAISRALITEALRLLNDSEQS